MYECEGRAVTSCQWDTHRTQLWENSVVFMSLALPEMPESTLITLGLSSGAPDSCGFPHHSHMAPSTPFYYLICSLSSPPLTLFCQASDSPETTPASNRLALGAATAPESASGSAASLGRIPVRILLLHTKSVCLDRKTFECRDWFWARSLGNLLAVV